MHILNSVVVFLEGNLLEWEWGGGILWCGRQFFLVAVILGGHFRGGVIFLGDSYPWGQLSGGAIIWGQLYGGEQFSAEASLRCFYSLNAHFEILNRLTYYF